MPWVFPARPSGRSGRDVIAEDEKQTGPRYEALKQRLWNQPRPRQFLERLEKHGARPALLERVARLFVAGRHGEAEILATIYYDLLRHRDRADLLRRIATLRVTSIKVAQELSAASDQLHRLKKRRAYLMLGYPDWTDFVKKELGLGEKLAALLLLVGEQTNEISLDALLRKMIHGYPTAASVHRQRPDLVWLIEETPARNHDPVGIQRQLAELRQSFASIKQNCSHIAGELHQLKNWEAYRVLGYQHFPEFSRKELGLSEETAKVLLVAREQADRSGFGEFFQVMIKGYVASSEPGRNGR